MNEIVNKFLLAGDKFMPEMHLKQPGFTYSACGPFTKNKEKIQRCKETGDKKYIYKNELDKACFQHNMACGDFKDLARGTDFDKVLRDLMLLKILSMTYIKERLPLWFTHFLIKSPQLLVLIRLQMKQFKKIIN